jgi:isopenicillin-N N-acyltransferase-like protein
MSVTALPIVKVSGNPLRRGREQGQGARVQIQRAITRYRKLLPDLLQQDWPDIMDASRHYLPYAEEAFPSGVEELRGIAQGSDVAFEEVWTLNCYEDLVDQLRYARGCTSLAVRDDLSANGHVLLAHNEDWLSIEADTIYLVRANQDQGPNYIGLAYGPLLVNIGFNDCGIGVAVDSVHSIDVQMGVPRIVYTRAVLNAKDLAEAIQACLLTQRAGGYHFLLADMQGELCSVETSASLHDLQQDEHGWLLHTNHYLSPKLKALERPGSHINSRLRLERAEHILRSCPDKISVEVLQNLLSDHASQPHAICMHADLSDPLPRRYQTLTSLVMDLNARVMWATKGPPCEGTYVAYEL